MIQKDELNFLSLYFKIKTSDKYDVNYMIILTMKFEGWRLNVEDETHTAQQSPAQF